MLRRTTIAVMIVGLGMVPVAARAADEPAPSKTESVKKAVKDTADTASVEMSDSWITLKTKLALLADERVSSLDVSVKTRKGVITLRGKVDNEAARQAAEEIALNIKGQKKVANHLTVVSKAARKVVDRQDDQIVKDVEKGINNDARLKKATIEVRADKGIVTLTGKAPSLETCVRASEVARRVHGVRAVRNEMTFDREG
ncbi:MAG TPA: BON domain-containing protein [Patescibacteria group bacterium]|nr:BON domain-containing protein [Patescibacteria group bacterium]